MKPSGPEPSSELLTQDKCVLCWILSPMTIWSSVAEVEWGESLCFLSEILHLSRRALFGMLSHAFTFPLETNIPEILCHWSTPPSPAAGSLTVLCSAPSGSQRGDFVVPSIPSYPILPFAHIPSPALRCSCASTCPPSQLLKYFSFCFLP